ncbi:MAG: hypothetical protein KKD39_04235 [Candidatus Altiarchaeota archaeon]|nr:hypothetical protein [Candidatus Altiarchaeota archaeon]
MKFDKFKIAGIALGGLYGLLTSAGFDCLAQAHGFCSSNLLFGLALPSTITFILVNNILANSTLSIVVNTLVWAVLGIIGATVKKKIYLKLLKKEKKQIKKKKKKTK